MAKLEQNNGVVSLDVSAASIAQPITPNLITKLEQLPAVIVDRNCLLKILEKHDLFTIIDRTELLTSMQEYRQTYTGTRVIDDVTNCATSLENSLRKKGIDILDKAVGFTCARLSPDATAAHLANARLRLNEQGVIFDSQKQITLNTDADLDLSTLEQTKFAILVIYDLSKLELVKDCKNGNRVFRLKPGHTFKDAYLGEITIVDGGAPGLALELAKYSETIKVHDSAALLARELIAEFLRIAEDDYKRLSKQADFDIIKPEYDAEIRVLEALKVELEKSNSTPSSILGFLQRKGDLAQHFYKTEGMETRWFPNQIYSGKYHPALSNLVEPQVWQGFPDGNVDVLAARHWLVERYAQVVSSSISNPLQAVADLLHTAQHYRKELQLGAPNFADIPYNIVNVERLSTLEGLKSACNSLTPDAEMKSYGDEGADTFRGTLPVISEHGRLRPCNPESSNELTLMRAAALNFLEEIIHIEQQAKWSTDTKVHGDPIYELTTSILTVEYLKKYRNTYYKEHAVGELSAIVSEVDALARQLEFAKRYDLPFEYIQEPLYVYHLDIRWHFVRWLVEVGELSREACPDYIFDNELLQQELEKLSKN